MAKKTYQALDHTGTQAAVYPSEDALWVNGPPINDPGDQGVVDLPMGGRLSLPQEDTYLHEVMNGETSNEAYAEEWVNVEQHGGTGFGGWNEQPFETGHSQNVVANPASEQGWGVGIARQWAHYPHEESPNPARNEGQHLRNGQLPWVSVDSNLYERTQLAWEQQWAGLKMRRAVAPVVPIAASVPFSQTVPTYSGGPAPHPGVDLPVGNEGLWGA